MWTDSEKPLMEDHAEDDEPQAYQRWHVQRLLEVEDADERQDRNAQP